MTSSNYQPLADWMTKSTCPMGHFLVAVRMRVLSDVGSWDDVAVSDFEFRRRGPGPRVLTTPLGQVPGQM